MEPPTKGTGLLFTDLGTFACKDYIDTLKE